MSLGVIKLFSFAEYEAPIYALEELSEDAFLSGGGDRLVSFRKAESGSTVHAIVNTGSTIYSLKYIREKNILLCGVSGGGIHVIDLSRKCEIHFLVNHQLGVYDIKYSHKYDIFFTAGGDGRVSIWSGKDFSFIKSLELCKEKIRTVCFDPPHNYALIGCGDGTIRFISMENLEEEFRVSAHKDSVNTLCFLPKSNVLVSGGKDAHLHFWDEKYTLTNSIPAHNYAIYSISFSPDGRFFATGSRDKTVKIWKSDTYEILLRIDLEKYVGHAFSVNKVLWLKDILLSAGDDKKVIGWQVFNQAPV